MHNNVTLFGDVLDIVEKTEHLSTAGLLTCKSVEYYTPSEYVEAAREVMGGIDIDPASNPIANKIVRAAIYYTKETNGFNKPWIGRCFMNPPYGHGSKECNQKLWSARLIEQYQVGNVTEAILLVNAAAGTRWYDTLTAYPVCIPRKRINFYTPEKGKQGATHGSALFYLGSRAEKFAKVFQQFGRVQCDFNAPYPVDRTLWSVRPTWEEETA